MAGRNTQVSRFYTIIEILQSARHGLTASDLCRHLKDRGWEVNKRTVYRDLEGLQAAGYPLVTHLPVEPGQGDRWALTDTPGKDSYLVLSPQEMRALNMAASSIGAFRGTPLYGALDKAVSLLKSKSGGHRIVSNPSTTPNDDIAATPRADGTATIAHDVWDAVHAACAERQVLEVTYDSAHSGTHRRRRLGPHFIYFAKGSVYLVAEDLETGQVKTFDLPRMTSPEMSDTPFDKPPLAPEGVFANQFGLYRGSTPERIRITFTGPLAPYARERLWHDTQQIIESATSGSPSVTIEMTVGISPELVTWVLGFGRHAKVTEPRTLAEMVKSEATAVVDRY